MRKLLMLMVVALLGLASYGEVMYWQVGSSGTNVADDKWTMAQIHVTGGATDTYLNIWTNDGWVEAGALDKSAGGAYFDLTGFTSSDPAYSFVLELVNDEYEVQGTSTAFSYAQLQSQTGVVQASIDSIGPLNYVSWNAGFVDIPEPTSGLMLLLGASLLALRRKQA
ncbi:MAG: PEP-CTERM sorting domain-containing protein [Kiritimatiellae bacterium]|nr:PEP-CTERM sorting domain-containing protein [Kiritimatiellia bacterium]